MLARGLSGRGIAPIPTDRSGRTCMRLSSISLAVLPEHWSYIVAMVKYGHFGDCARISDAGSTHQGRFLSIGPAYTEARVSRGFATCRRNCQRGVPISICD